jgi:hypothetical protein
MLPERKTWCRTRGFGGPLIEKILIDRLGKDVSLEPRPIDPGLLKEAKRALRLSASDIRRASQPGKRKVKLNRNCDEGPCFGREA